MSYLVCDKCNKYYELQPGELPGDFDDKCDCGGNLKFTSNVKGLKEKTVQTNKKTPENDLKEDKQFFKEHNKGYKIKPTSNTQEVVHGAIWFIKVAFFLFAIIITIIALLIFLPVGLLMLLGTYGIYKIMF